MFLQKKNSLITVGVLMTLYIQLACTTDCPNLAVLNNLISITANYSQLSGFSWTRPSDGRYIAICNNLSSSQSSCSPVGVYTAVATNTESQLTINGAGLDDVGQWRLTHEDIITEVCTLSAAGIPSCNITSDLVTDDLDLDKELTLSIDVEDYYCTRQHNVNISLGDVTEHLFSNTSASNITSHTSALTFNITKEHFGDVRVIFECEDFSTTLTCSGVERLSQATTQATPTTTATPATPTTTTTNPPEATTQATPTTTATPATPTTTARTGGVLEPTEEPDLGLILGITIPLILVVLAAILVFLCRKKCKKTYKYILRNSHHKKTSESKTQMCYFQSVETKGSIGDTPIEDE